MPHTRVLAALALATPLLFAPVAAYAGPAETALLAAYAGNWQGSGEITGENAGKLKCRLAFKAGTSGKLTYNGRCSFGSGAASFTGTMQYSDANKRYEAITAARGQTATTIGKPQGGGVVFTTTTDDDRIGKVATTIALSGGNAITLSFKMTTPTGESNSSSIAFTRS